MEIGDIRDFNILLSEKPDMDKKNRLKIAEIMFETYKFVYLFVTKLSSYIYNIYINK